MNETHRPDDVLQFKALLRRWMIVVDHYAHRRRRRQPVSSEEYLILHSDLLKACRRQLAGADPTDRQALQTLIDLVGPWVTFESITNSQTSILTNLSAQCLAAEYVLDGCKSRAIPRTRIALAASLLLVGLLGVVLLSVGGGVRSFAANMDQCQRSVREFVWSLSHSNSRGEFAFLTAIVVVAGTFMLTKGLRKWT